MDQTNLIQAKILKHAEILKLGPQSKVLLEAFLMDPNKFTEPQESFINACQIADLVGPDSIRLASRLKCEHIIESVYKDENLEANLDSIGIKLMVDKPKEK